MKDIPILEEYGVYTNILGVKRICQYYKSGKDGDILGTTRTCHYRRNKKKIPNFRNNKDMPKLHEKEEYANFERVRKICPCYRSYKDAPILEYEEFANIIGVSRICYIQYRLFSPNLQ
mgnify:CR=1 FL=1